MAEYADLIAIVAILVLAVATTVPNVDLCSKVDGRINEILNAGGGGGKLPFVSAVSRKPLASAVGVAVQLFWKQHRPCISCERRRKHSKMLGN